MPLADPPASRERNWLPRLGKLVIWALAAFGLLALVGPSMMQLVSSRAFVTEVRRTVPSPDGGAEARIEVRRGFGTVHTTRVLLTAKGGDTWTIYETGDSDFEPSLRWIGRDTLLMGLGCEVFGHISNPDDWERSNPNERRLKVRVTYIEPCP